MPPPACPFCRTLVAPFPTPQGLVCPACRNTGQVGGGIPPRSGSGKTVAIVLGVVGGVVVLSIVLSGVVFVLVDNLGKGGDPTAAAPVIRFHQDEAADTLTVYQPDPEADWSDVEASFGGGAACRLALNGADVPTSGLVGRNQPRPTPVQAADTFAVSGPAGQQCNLALRHVPSGSALGSWTFRL